MFFNMESELKALNKAFSTEKAELIIVYGRRRLGKTTLVRKALDKLDGIYLYTPRGTIEDVLLSYSEDIRDQTGSFVSFKNWRDFLEYLKHRSKEKFVVVIDEFQRLSEVYKPAITLIQKYWDIHLQHSKIKIVLVGSVIGLIEKLALTGEAPLFGRKTRELKIGPLDYFTYRSYLNNLDEIEKIKYYGVFGGTIGYFTKIEKSASLLENIENLILNQDSPLAREPEQLLNEETRAPYTYLSILSNLARSGRGLPLSKIHVRRGTATVYLNNLIKMDIVEKIRSLAQGNHIYAIKDEFFRFWFHFIYPRISLLEMKKGKLLLDRIKSNLDEYLSFTFEKILRGLILHISGKKLKGVKIPTIDDIGSFWWKNIEIDVCAKAGNTLILGEAKWRNEKVDRKEILKFIAKAEKATDKTKKKDWIGIIMSKTGFTRDALNLETDNLLLVDINEIKNYV